MECALRALIVDPVSTARWGSAATSSLLVMLVSIKTNVEDQPLASSTTPTLLQVFVLNTCRSLLGP